MPEMKTFVINGTKYEVVDETARESIKGLAPGGYGLGGQGKVCTDCNTALESGFYSLSGGSLQNGPSADTYLYWGSMIVANRSGNVITQLVNYQNRLALRTCEDGAWGEWEYLNPRMIPGVEYRTTERINGKVVYAKTINIGTLTKQELSIAYHSGTAHPVRVEGRIWLPSGTTRTLPCVDASCGTIAATANNNKVWVRGTSDGIINGSAIVVVYYAKEDWAV